MARLIFLGTSAALPTAERTNALLAVIPDTQPSGLLIDCGGDVYAALQRARLGPDAISDLLITHAHIDHIGSLSSLIESLRLGGRTTPLRIYALPEVIEVARRIVQVFDYELTLDSGARAWWHAGARAGHGPHATVGRRAPGAAARAYGLHL